MWPQTLLLRTYVVLREIECKISPQMTDIKHRTSHTVSQLPLISATNHTRVSVTLLQSGHSCAFVTVP